MNTATMNMICSHSLNKNGIVVLYSFPCLVFKEFYTVFYQCWANVPSQPQWARVPFSPHLPNNCCFQSFWFGWDDTSFGLDLFPIKSAVELFPFCLWVICISLGKCLFWSLPIVVELCKFLLKIFSMPDVWCLLPVSRLSFWFVMIEILVLRMRKPRLNLSNYFSHLTAECCRKLQNLWFYHLPQCFCEWMPLGLGCFSHRVIIPRSLLTLKLWLYNKGCENTCACSLIHFQVTYIVIELSPWIQFWEDSVHLYRYINSHTD